MNILKNSVQSKCAANKNTKKSTTRWPKSLIVSGALGAAVARGELTAKALTVFDALSGLAQRQSNRKLIFKTLGGFCRAVGCPNNGPQESATIAALEQLRDVVLEAKRWRNVVTSEISGRVATEYTERTFNGLLTVFWDDKTGVNIWIDKTVWDASDTANGHFAIVDPSELRHFPSATNKVIYLFLKCFPHLEKGWSANKIATTVGYSRRSIPGLVERINAVLRVTDRFHSRRRLVMLTKDKKIIIPKHVIEEPLGANCDIELHPNEWPGDLMDDKINSTFGKKNRNRDALRQKKLARLRG